MNATSIHAALVVSILLAACARPEDMCRRAADELNARARRCDPALLDDRASWLFIESELTSARGCGAVQDLRDIDAFVSVCLPALAELTCIDATLPPECESQIILHE